MRRNAKKNYYELKLEQDYDEYYDSWDPVPSAQVTLTTATLGILAAGLAFEAGQDLLQTEAREDAQVGKLSKF